MQVIVNGTKHDVNVSPAMPLLWFLRESLGLTGTKFGCGMAQCGACTVHVNGEALRSCVMPVSAVAGKGDTPHRGVLPGATPPLPRAPAPIHVPPCGHCPARPS